MSPTELSYEELKQEFIDDIKKQPFGALATSDGDNVTNRFMVLISDELTLYCFTGVDTRKFKQILSNPKVSIATGSLQIDGIAADNGHPLDESNARFIELFKEQQPEVYKNHEKTSIPLPSSRVILITPTRIGKWVGDGNVDLLNIAKGKAYRLAMFGEFQVPEYYE